MTTEKQMRVNAAKLTLVVKVQIQVAQLMPAEKGFENVAGPFGRVRNTISSPRRYLSKVNETRSKETPAEEWELTPKFDLQLTRIAYYFLHFFLLPLACLTPNSGVDMLLNSGVVPLVCAPAVQCT